MPMKTYKVHMQGAHQPTAEDVTRKGHIIRVAGVDLSLYRVTEGYRVDHVRSGMHLHQLDMLATPGAPVTLAEAKEDIVESARPILERNADRIASMPTLNEGFA